MNEPLPPDQQLPADLTGQQLGDFLLLRKLGRGGMADVYLAQQESLHRQVAFKVLQQQFAGDTAYIRRFHNEAKAAAALVHPNIVQIFEVGQVDDVHFIVQEYVQGQNLQQFLHRSGAAEPLLAISIMRQVATALQTAAAAGVVHRDIKPENIMISSRGEVKVADFGLARLTDDPKATALTRTGITMGTPKYMSPEQIEGRNVDQRSDIYSFGITCYQMLAGLPPFDAETALAVAVQHMNQEPALLSQHRPDLPQKLCDIVHRMISKNPDQRQSDGTELLRELLQIEIEGSRSNWNSAFEKLSLSEAQSLYSEPRLEVTRRLDRAIGGRSASKAGWWKWIAGLMLAASTAFMVGWIAPVLYPPGYVLSNVEPALKVARKGDAKQQYDHAYYLNTVEGWQAVSAYFPAEESSTNSYYGKLALTRLGGLCLEQQQLGKAWEIFDQLSRLQRAADANFRHIGLAGKLVVSARRRDETFVRENIQEVIDNLSALDQSLASNVRQIQQKLLNSQ